MTLQTAARVPFHPLQCPVCTHYMAAANRCRAYAVESPAGTLLAVLGEESVEACPRFETGTFTDSAAEPVSAEPFIAEDERVESKAADGFPPLSAGAVEAALPETAPVVTPPAIPVEAPPEKEAVMLEPARGTALIHCIKCGGENPLMEVRCQRCNTKLLPSESMSTRLGNFIMFIIIAAGLGYLVYHWYVQDPGSAPDIPILEEFLNPIVLGIATFIAFIAAFVMLLRRTPEYVKYKERATRHEKLNPWQSLDDLDRAIDLAPDKEQGALINQRAKIYEAVGLVNDAARDRLILATSPGRFKGEADLASLITGADAGVYENSRRGSEITTILKSGKALAISYCRKCDKAVVLNTDQRCPEHPKEKFNEIEYVIPADKLAGKLAACQKVEWNRPKAVEAITSLLENGKATALGICPKCRGVVELDAQRHCKAHPKAHIRSVQYAVPRDVPATRKRIIKLDQLTRHSRRRNWVSVAILFFSALIFLSWLDVDILGAILRLFKAAP